MLREIQKTRQIPGEPRGRWFSGSNMDLFIRLNDDDEVVSYQLTYDEPHAQKALTWARMKAFLILALMMVHSGSLVSAFT